jgi:hypothetical protein
MGLAFWPMCKLCLIVWLISIGGLCAQSSLERMGFVYDKPEPTAAQKQATARKEAQARSEAAAEQRNNQMAGLARHPWRVIGGVTNHVGGAEWMRFYGRAKKVTKEGVLVDGWIVAPAVAGVPFVVGDFFVRDFPFPTEAGEEIKEDHSHLAKAAPMLEMKSAKGVVAKVRCLDYGVPCAAPTALATKAVPTKAETGGK